MTIHFAACPCPEPPRSGPGSARRPPGRALWSARAGIKGARIWWHKAATLTVRAPSRGGLALRGRRKTPPEGGVLKGRALWSARAGIKGARIWWYNAATSTGRAPIRGGLALRGRRKTPPEGGVLRGWWIDYSAATLAGSASTTMSCMMVLSSKSLGV